GIRVPFAAVGTVFLDAQACDLVERVGLTALVQALAEGNVAEHSAGAQIEDSVYFAGQEKKQSAGDERHNHHDAPPVRQPASSLLADPAEQPENGKSTEERSEPPGSLGCSQN